MANADDIDKEITFIEQKLQELKNDSLSIHNASLAKDTSANKTSTPDVRSETKSKDSGFASGRFSDTVNLEIFTSIYFCEFGSKSC